MDDQHLPCCGKTFDFLTNELGTLVCSQCSQIYAPTTVAFKGAIRVTALEDAARTVERGLGQTNTQIARTIRNLR